jgi:hypothetical protein
VDHQRNRKANKRRASLRAWLHTTSQSETDQLGKVAHPRLVHEPRTVDLDGPRTDPQIVGNRFVGQPGEETLQDLPLARRKQRELRGRRGFGWISRCAMTERRRQSSRRLDELPPDRRAIAACVVALC